MQNQQTHRVAEQLVLFGDKNYELFFKRASAVRHCAIALKIPVALRMCCAFLINWRVIVYRCVHIKYNDTFLYKQKLQCNLDKMQN